MFSGGVAVRRGGKLADCSGVRRHSPSWNVGTRCSCRNSKVYLIPYPALAADKLGVVQRKEQELSESNYRIICLPYVSRLDVKGPGAC